MLEKIYIATTASFLGANMEYDLIISGGRVIDGTGAAAIQADIAISNGRIARIGDLGTATAAETIDAKGKVVTPDLSTCIPIWMPKSVGIH